MLYREVMDFHFFGHRKVMESQCWKRGAPWEGTRCTILNNTGFVGWETSQKLQFFSSSVTYPAMGMGPLLLECQLHSVWLQSNHRHQQTNTQLLTDRMPFLLPNQQCQSTEGCCIPKIITIGWFFMGLLKKIKMDFLRCTILVFILFVVVPVVVVVVVVVVVAAVAAAYLYLLCVSMCRRLLPAAMQNRWWASTPWYIGHRRTGELNF